MPGLECCDAYSSDSLIPKEFSGKTVSITSRNGKKTLELRRERIKSPKGFWKSILGGLIYNEPIDEVPLSGKMTLSLLIPWGGGFKNIMRVFVEKDPTTGESQLGVSFPAIPAGLNSKSFRNGTLGVEYNSKDGGVLSKRPRKIVSPEGLQFLSSQGMLHEEDLPPKINLEATIEGFLKFFKEMLVLQELGQLPEDFSLPELVPVPEFVLAPEFVPA